MRKNLTSDKDTTVGFYSCCFPNNYIDDCVAEVHEHIDASNYHLQDKVTSVEDALKNEIWCVQSEQRELLKIISEVFYTVVICAIMFGVVAIFQILCTCRIIQDIQAIQTTTQGVSNAQ